MSLARGTNFISKEGGREKEGHPVQRWEEAGIAFCHLINNQPIYSL